MDLTPKILVRGTSFLGLPHFFPGGSNSFFQRVGRWANMSPPSRETFGGFFGGGRGGEEEDRKQQLYKYLRVFAKTPGSLAHAGNYVNFKCCDLAPKVAT